MTAVDTIGYQVHPVAALFPLIEGADFGSFTEDIRVNGQRVRVVVDAAGRLIDGRNRVRACRVLGIDVLEEKYEGGDVTKYILSINMQRRHLTDAQRAMIAAQMANLRHGSNQFKESPDGDSSSTPVTRGEVKEILHVSEGSLGRATNIIRDGVPELVELATSGAVPLSTGERVAAELTPTEQHNFVTQVKEGANPVTIAPPTTPKKAGDPRPPAPPKHVGNRKRHAAIIDSINVGLAGYAFAIDGITELDSTVTKEEAARLRGDLSEPLSKLTHLSKLLKERIA